MTRYKLGALGALAGLLMLTFTGGAAAEVPAARAAVASADAGSDPLSVLGASRLDAEGLVASMGASAHSARLTVPLADLASMFIEEAEVYGVRADLAWAQSLVETAWLRYPDYGQVRWTDNNYAGIGAFDGGAHGFHYPDARTGVRAQMQLLRQYADATPIDPAPAEIVVRAPRSKLGVAPSWRDMGNGNWATSTRYSETVTRVYLRMLDATGTSLDEPAPRRPAALLRAGDGLWLAGADGQVYDVGDTRFWGSAADRQRSGPVVAVESTRSGDGYWIVTRDGNVFSYGDSHRVSRHRARSAAPIAAAVSPRGRGLWLVGAGGGVVAVGGAPAISPAPGAVAPGARLVGIAATASGRGYWLADSAGRVVAAGDASDLGDLYRDAPTARPAGSLVPGSPEDPVAAIASTPAGDGYWLVTAGGAVSAFGGAADLGSLEDALPNGAARAGTAAGTAVVSRAYLAVAIAPTPTGLGYWIVCSDGTVAGFGDAASLGDVTSDGVPVLAATSRRPRH